MTGVPPLSKSIGWTRGIIEGRSMMLDLQRQLATGKKAASYGGLGPERSLALATRARLSSIAAFQSTIQTVDLRIKVMTQALDRYAQIGREVRGDALMPSYELTGGDRTALQARATNALDEALALLRTDVAGRHLFAGSAVEASPVAAMSAILQGTGDKAGFEQVIAERKAADLGDGLGRLLLPAPAPGATELTVAQEAEMPFGFTIKGVSTGISGATAGMTGAVPPAAMISLDGASPQPGDKVRLTLGMPDGSETAIELSAVPPGQGAPGKFEIGVDAEQTTANLHAALTSAVEKEAATGLASASAFAAAEDFFRFDADNPPRRVDGPPFDSATGFRADDTTQDTVLWYTGDAGAGDPRQTSVARIDDQIAIAYGARANEEALRGTVQTLAVLAAETFHGGIENDKLRYQEMTSRAVTALAPGDGKPTPESLQTQIAAQHHTLGKTGERHHAMKAVAEELLGQVEEADPHEVAAKLLQLQTRLEASYQVTAMLSRMSLVYYL